MEKVLDLRGAVCPVPALRTKAVLESLSKGDVLEVILDYPPAEENVKRFVQIQGHEVLSVEQKGCIIRLRIKKT